MWFEDLMGFREENPDQVRRNCHISSGVLTSRVNGKKYRVGTFETPTLRELRESTGNRNLYLTLLGGGAFGNHTDWILSAIRRALHIVASHDLGVKIVSYGSSRAEVHHLAEEFVAD